MTDYVYPADNTAIIGGHEYTIDWDEGNIIYCKKELAPCPFCGGGAEITHFGNDYVICGCMECGATSPRVSLRNSDIFPGEHPGERPYHMRVHLIDTEMIVKAAELWNRRANEMQKGEDA